MNAGRRLPSHGHSAGDIALRLSRSKGAGHLRDLVYGGIDGSVTTLAIVAGVQGAGLSERTIIALGIANVLADGFSMAAGNFAGIRAESDNLRRLRDREKRHIEQYPEGEKEEIRQILAIKGYSGQQLEQCVELVTANESVWIEMMLMGEYGVSPVDQNAWSGALATFIAFSVCGLIPLSPFLFQFNDPFALSIMGTAALFFAIGSIKSRWSDSAWWRSGLGTLLIGGVAALIAYYTGSAAAVLAEMISA